MDPMDECVYPIIHSGDIPTENGAIRFRFMPTLQHMATVKIVSHFFANQINWDKIAPIYKNQALPPLTSFIPLITEITEKVGELPLPDKLLSRISYVGSRLTLEVFRWMQTQKRIDHRFKSEDYLHCIQWRSSGRINEEATLHNILSTENISEQYRKDATIYYCFNLNGEDLLRQTVDRCPKHAYNFDETYILKPNEQFSDTRIIRGPVFMLIMNSLSEGALRRLWGSLTLETQSNILSNLQYFSRRNDHFCFLLSQMDVETQMNFFQRYQCILLLELFHDWLWQDFFLPSIVKILPMIQDSSLEIALCRMASLTSEYFYSSKDRQIFINFLHIIKLNMESSIWQNIHFGSIIPKLFRSRSLDIIDLIIALISSDQKAKNLNSIILFIIDSTDDQSELLQFIVNRFFKNREEIEQFFLKNDFYFNDIKRLIKNDYVERVEAFIKIFLCDKGIIDTLKSRILKETVGRNLDCLVAKSRFVAVNKILSLCFTGNDRDILEYKTRIMRGLNPQALSYMIMNKGCVSALEEFFCFFFGKKDGISIGRNQLLQDKEMLAKMSDHLLTYKKPSLIEEFLDWCFSCDVEGRDAFKMEWREISTVHRLHEIYQACYLSEDPKELLEESRLPTEELKELGAFCQLMHWPEYDKTGLAVIEFVHQEIECREEDSVFLSFPDLALTLDFFDSDTGSDFSDTDSISEFGSQSILA